MFTDQIPCHDVLLRREVSCCQVSSPLTGQHDCCSVKEMVRQLLEMEFWARKIADWKRADRTPSIFGLLAKALARLSEEWKCAA